MSEKKGLNKQKLGDVAGGIEKGSAVKYRCINPKCKNHWSITTNVGNIANISKDGIKICKLCGGNIESVPHY